MWEFLSYYEEEIKKAKEILKISILSLFIIFLIFLLIKTFYLNRPKIPPEEIAVSFLKAAQSPKGKPEDDLHPDLKKVEIFGQNYQQFKAFQIIQKEREGENPFFEIKNKKIEKKKAKIEVFERTNKKEGWFFFGYSLPKEISFRIELEKIGNWKRGYQWRIIKVDSSDLIKEAKFGEKVELEKGIFVRPIKIEEYQPENIKIPEGIKIFSLEIEYENDSEGELLIDPFSNWRIIDGRGNVFSPPSITSAIFLREPSLFGQKLKKNEKIRGYVVFEVPKEVLPKKIIYKDWQRKIEFEL